MKRFYKAAEITAQSDGYRLFLDGREVKTPEKRETVIPTEALARAICAEWNAQTDKVDPASMPLTKLLNTAIDRVRTRRRDLIEDLVRYAASDMLCYRAAHPDALVREQEAFWQPLLERIARRHEIRLKVTTGIAPVEQDPDALTKVRTILERLNDVTLAGFYNITTLCGSVTVALNVLDRDLDADQAWAAAQLEENFQIAQWGVDEEAKIRQDNMKRDLDDAIRFIALCEGSRQEGGGD